MQVRLIVSWFDVVEPKQIKRGVCEGDTISLKIFTMALANTFKTRE